MFVFKMEFMWAHEACDFLKFLDKHHVHHSGLGFDPDKKNTTIVRVYDLSPNQMHGYISLYRDVSGITLH